MNKLLFLLIFSPLLSLAMINENSHLYKKVNTIVSKNDSLTYSDGELYTIIEIPGKTKEELFKKSKEWIYRTYKNGDAVIDIADSETSKINAQGITQSVIYKNSFVKMDGGKFKYYLTIFSKDGKVKILFDQIIHLKGDMAQMSDGSKFTDEFPSTWGKFGKSQSAKQWPLMKSQALIEFNQIYESFKKYLTEENKHSDF